MPLSRALADFRNAVSQCDSLIVSAHRQDAAGNSLFQPLDREQITIAAFLNMFIAWEGFLEESVISPWGRLTRASYALGSELIQTRW